MRILVFAFVLACGSSTEKKPEPAKPDPAKPASAWAVPAGWKSETIPFPLDFAPTIKHTGVEELRFPPGFFKPEAPDYWSYAFIWRTTDAAMLDAKALGDELTLYFKGLITAVDEKKQQIKDKDAVVATATGDGTKFEVKAHAFDAFGTGQPVDLVGWAERRACDNGALWLFVLAPEKTSIRTQLDELAKSATCAIPTTKSGS